jgi:hypothetical protein
MYMKKAVCRKMWVVVLVLPFFLFSHLTAQAQDTLELIPDGTQGELVSFKGYPLGTGIWVWRVGKVWNQGRNSFLSDKAAAHLTVKKNLPVGRFC